MYPFPEIADVDGLYTASLERARNEVQTKMDKKMRRSRARARRLRKLATGNRFLDVGSNVGFMVEAAREAGFEATGVEIDENYVNIAKEFFPQNTFLAQHVEDHQPDHDGYHLIYCSEVIEHVPDVRQFAATLSRLLCPGGILFVTTPDISHWRVPAKITDWDAFCPPSHCIYFNPKNLSDLFEGCGLVYRKKLIAFKPGVKMIFQRPG